MQIQAGTAIGTLNAIVQLGTECEKKMDDGLRKREESRQFTGGELESASHALPKLKTREDYRLERDALSWLSKVQYGYPQIPQERDFAEVALNFLFARKWDSESTAIVAKAYAYCMARKQAGDPNAGRGAIAELERLSGRRLLAQSA